ncbi:hypothetical protein MCHI_000063 [Candidatus Magnetoovum chiemensis]|nr:hypothetical protein MCHI_000063 [Candidatus Magnetoovum chiemensis]
MQYIALSSSFVLSSFISMVRRSFFVINSSRACILGASCVILASYFSQIEMVSSVL